MQLTTVAVDLAKSVFQVAESQHPGRVDREQRLNRTKFERFVTELEPSRFLLEACGSSHHWGRFLQARGHTIVLLPPHHVRRYRAGNKTDAADAKALLEAFRNEALHPVPVKTVDQQALASLHRLRSAWMRSRVARINLVRGLLREYGITIPLGARKVLPQVRLITQGEIPLPLRQMLTEVADEIRVLETRIGLAERQLAALGAQMPAVAHLRTIPGIGPLTSTALVALVGDVRRFRSGRRFASFLGLTPREHSSGSKRRLGSINKQGDAYLRTLLIHGARSILKTARTKPEPSPLQTWALELRRRRSHAVAIVAVANHLARIAWKVWKEERDFRPAA